MADNTGNKTYIAIDLKSFYASVECRERGLDPLDTNLVVADVSRTEKTICLAVSPSMKQYGIPGRARLFEIIERVKEINKSREQKAPGHTFTKSSFLDSALKADPSLSLDYIAAPPRMAFYMQYSTDIFNIYQKYVSPDDIHVYSIDEVFIDATDYLKFYKVTAREFAMRMILDVFNTTGITATAGIGTNLYLCKIAMDIEAKHTQPDENGVRIAELDEMGYRKRLWSHRPLTDFWRIGAGYEKSLAGKGLYTMGDIARCSIKNEDVLYKLFGVNAELLIDHAWGCETCTIADIKAYRPENTSLSSGQVLKCPYSFEKAKLIVREMTELLVLDLVRKELTTNKLVLYVGYDAESLSNPEIRKYYKGEITCDRYGRKLPKDARGSINLHCRSSSTKLIVNSVSELFDSIVGNKLLIRRVSITADNLKRDTGEGEPESYQQLDLFTDYDAIRKKNEEEEKRLRLEKSLQKTTLSLMDRFGKNAVLKGINLEEGATTVERNGQIGGHKA